MRIQGPSGRVYEFDGTPTKEQLAQLAEFDKTQVKSASLMGAKAAAKSKIFEPSIVAAGVNAAQRAGVPPVKNVVTGKPGPVLTDTNVPMFSQDAAIPAGDPAGAYAAQLERYRKGISPIEGVAMAGQAIQDVARKYIPETIRQSLGKMIELSQDVNPITGPQRQLSKALDEAGIKTPNNPKFWADRLGIDTKGMTQGQIANAVSVKLQEFVESGMDVSNLTLSGLPGYKTTKGLVAGTALTPIDIGLDLGVLQHGKSAEDLAGATLNLALNLNIIEPSVLLKAGGLEALGKGSVKKKIAEGLGVSIENAAKLVDNAINQVKQNPKILEMFDISGKVEKKLKPTEIPDISGVPTREKISPATAGPATTTKEPKATPKANIPEAVDTAKVGGKPITEAVASNKENVAAQRAKRNLPDLPEPERKSIETMIDEAAKSGENGLDYARTVLKNPKPVGSKGTAILTLEAGKINQQIEDILSKATNTSDNAELKVLADKMDLLTEDLNTVHKAVLEAGTEWGREGIARQIELSGDMSAPGIQLKMRKFKELSAEDVKYSVDVETRFNDYETKIKGLQDELAAERAKGTTAREARKAPRFSKKELDDELDQLLKEFSAQRSKVTSGVDPEMLVTVGKIAVNYMKRGINTLDDLYDAVKKHIPGLSYDEFIDGIDRATKGIPRTRTDLQEQIGKLKRQAKSDAYARQKLNEYRRRLNEGDYEVPSKEAKVISDRIKDLRAEQNLLKREVDARIGAREKKTLWDKTKSVLNAPRTLKTSFDLSAGGRQGWILGITNPGAAKDAFIAQMKSIPSEKLAEKVQNTILDSPNSKIYGKMKLYIAPLEGHGEEYFQSRAFDWWKKYNPIRASERAYIAYMNALRTSSADRLYNTLNNWTKTKLTDEDLKVLGNYANVTSGRGGTSLPKLEAAMDAFNVVLFAPRYAKSRVEYILGQPLFTTSVPWTKSLKARAIVAREYAKFLGVMGTALGLIKFYKEMNPESEVEVNTDFGSTDAGKVKIGNTRIDFGAGLLQYMTFMYRMGTGRYVTSNGKVVDLKNPKYGEPKFSDVATRFVRSKTAPIPGAIWNWREGKDYVGNPVDATSTIVDLTAPLSVQELVEGLRKDGWSRDDALTLLNFLGFSTQNYDEEQKKPSKQFAP